MAHLHLVPATARPRGIVPAWVRDCVYAWLWYGCMVVCLRGCGRDAHRDAKTDFIRKGGVLIRMLRWMHIGYSIADGDAYVHSYRSRPIAYDDAYGSLPASLKEYKDTPVLVRAPRKNVIWDHLLPIRILRRMPAGMRIGSLYGSM